ncbi:MAG: Protein of unknown function (DUF1350) [Phormidesmis priestleyi Ana]|uniref:DUF1350 domain-containing protein n=1 Tax=Phormidesmis priestleyi Ana TaxID=1666911 RepID=A0A0N8KMY9_9CYAN|nr:MAG: Protein of unknown function (DUF1350) [Phormidesmis priestleyi Ana]
MPFRFQPHAHSWVALHPKPQGIVQFIGGAFFGSYPTLFYRQLLRPFYDAGYTVVALPFRFSFSHWSIALSLLEEHYAIRESIIETALRHPGYEIDAYLNAANYCWLGHSLGCKYIALLELLSAPKEILTAYFDGVGVSPQQWLIITQRLQMLVHTLRQLEDNIKAMTGKTVNYGLPSIYNEASLLIAPAITDLEGAIPMKSLEKLFRKVAATKQIAAPSVDQTHALIERSKLFNVTHLFEFEQDAIARSTCRRLLQEQPNITASLLPGTHLSPIHLFPMHWWDVTQRATNGTISAAAVAKIEQLQQSIRPSIKPGMRALVQPSVRTSVRPIVKPVQLQENF